MRNSSLHRWSTSLHSFTRSSRVSRAGRQAAGGIRTSNPPSICNQRLAGRSSTRAGRRDDGAAGRNRSTPGLRRVGTNFRADSDARQFSKRIRHYQRESRHAEGDRDLSPQVNRHGNGPIRHVRWHCGRSERLHREQRHSRFLAGDDHAGDRHTDRR